MRVGGTVAGGGGGAPGVLVERASVRGHGLGPSLVATASRRRSVGGNHAAVDGPGERDDRQGPALQPAIGLFFTRGKEAVEIDV